MLLSSFASSIRNLYRVVHLESPPAQLHFIMKIFGALLLAAMASLATAAPQCSMSMYFLYGIRSFHTYHVPQVAVEVIFLAARVTTASVTRRVDFTLLA